MRSESAKKTPGRSRNLSSQTDLKQTPTLARRVWRRKQKAHGEFITQTCRYEYPSGCGGCIKRTVFKDGALKVAHRGTHKEKGFFWPWPLRMSIRDFV